MGIFFIAMAVSVTALLVAERKQSRLGRWITKPLSSTVFVAAALSRGALDTAYGRAILVALALSWLGDLLLIPGTPIFFQAGLGSFLLSHLAFATAFLIVGMSLPPALAALAVLAIVAVAVARWLLPHVPRELRIPVIAYMSVITLMVSASTGTLAATHKPLYAVAAVIFYLSDLSVARDTFVAPGFINRLWGLPFYYAAQLLFVMTL